MNIFLADLQNSYYGAVRNSIPLGMGYVGAYQKKIFGDQINVQMFRKFEELYDALEHTKPDLVAFGSYSWNTRLTLQSAKYLRERFPDIVIAVGGADIAPSIEIAKKDLQDNPHIDFYMPEECEMRLHNLIEAHMAIPDRKKLLGTFIEGCMSLNPETGEVEGVPGARVPEINDIPSPVLNGMMDRFLKDPNYLPILQTSRGCPYGCTFCVSGKDSWRKIKPFDIERVFEEIDYLAANSANFYLRFADENFGILKRDVEIAEYVIKVREKTGFPTSVSIYTDKHPTERVKQISVMLKDLLPFNISYQTTTNDVLTNIKRINLKESDVTRAIEFAREEKLIPVTELIFGLPGESKQSFLGAVDNLVRFRFDSIGVNQLRILKGSEMDLPEDREKHGVKTMFAMSENGYTKHGVLENIEIDEYVIGNNTLTEDEYFFMNRFIFLFDFSFYLSYLKDILFLFETRGILTSSLLVGTLNDEEGCPVTNKGAIAFEAWLRNFLKDDVQSVIENVHKQVSGGSDKMTGLYIRETELWADLLMKDNLGTVIDEISSVGLRLLMEKDGAIPIGFEEEIAAIKKVSINGFVPIHHKVGEDVDVEITFDVPAWIRSNYSSPLSNYKLSQPKKFVMRIPNIEIYNKYWTDDSKSVRAKYLHYLSAINSANRRRYFVMSDQIQATQDDDLSIAS